MEIIYYIVHSIDATYYDALNERLNLGMDFKEIKVYESKYYAYRGLYLSSSSRIEHKELRKWT